MQFNVINDDFSESISTRNNSKTKINFKFNAFRWSDREQNGRERTNQARRQEPHTDWWKQEPQPALAAPARRYHRHWSPKSLVDCRSWLGRPLSAIRAELERVRSSFGVNRTFNWKVNYILVLAFRHPFQTKFKNKLYIGFIFKLIKICNVSVAALSNTDALSVLNQRGGLRFWTFVLKKVFNWL